MPNTDPYNQNIPFSLLGDAPNAQTLGQSIVDAATPQLVMRFDSASARASILSGAQAAVPGMVTYLVAEDRYEAYTNGQGWVQITPGPWIPLPLQTGYSAFAGAPAYRLLNGSVELRGQISKTDGSLFTSNGSTGYQIAVLPAGYRPLYTVEMVGAQELATNYYCRIEVDTDGTVIAFVATGGSPHWVGLDNLRFSTV